MTSKVTNFTEDFQRPSQNVSERQFRLTISTNRRETAPTKKAAPTGTALNTQSQAILLDLAFLVFDMLAHNRVILTYRHLFGHGAGVFLGHIEMARACGRVQTALDGRRLRQWLSPAPGARAARESLMKPAF